MARTDPRRKPERRPYKIRGPEIWALVRESYLAGASARQLAARYDVTAWAIWRRAWREEWSKRKRVGPPPPPALERLTPDADTAPANADAASLSREALNGVARALSQGRLDEARQLGQLAASLGRVDGGPGRGAGAGSGPGAGRDGFTLKDMVRMVFDLEYRTEVMRVDRDRDPPEAKIEYWRLSATTHEAAGRALVDLKTEGWREGRAELRAELGLEVEDEAEREAAYRFYGGKVYRRRRGDGEGRFRAASPVDPAPRPVEADPPDD